MSGPQMMRTRDRKEVTRALEAGNQEVLVETELTNHVMTPMVEVPMAKVLMVEDLMVEALMVWVPIVVDLMAEVPVEVIQKTLVIRPDQTETPLMVIEWDLVAKGEMVIIVIPFLLTKVHYCRN